MNSTDPTDQSTYAENSSLLRSLKMTPEETKKIVLIYATYLPCSLNVVIAQNSLPV